MYQTIHFQKFQDLTGFVMEITKEGKSAKVLTRASLTSDEPEFYQYIEKITDIFSNKIQIDTVYRFLVIIHQDLSADLYINDFEILSEIRVKRDIKAGETVMASDIADIRKVKFPKIDIKETDKIIYCFKVQWRFGLFFDLTPRTQPTEVSQKIHTERLDIEKMQITIGNLYRYLSFYHVYKTLESKEQFNEMLKDGWFPFTEIVANEYKKLTEIYQNKFDFENKIKIIVDSFGKERIQKMVEKWWKNKIFSDKRVLIEAGINGYLQNNQEGYINCIRNITPEIEGILRKIYFAETGKANKILKLLEYITKKGEEKTGSAYSLLLPTAFLEYMKDVIFADFNIESGSVPMSRNSSGHGVADIDQFTKNYALQLILTLDQIYYCI